MLKDIFVSDVRINILQLMLPHPDKQHHVRAIVREVGAEINAVRRELQKLEKNGLLKKRQSGNRIYYTVNPSHIYYPELLSLVSKEYGICGQILKCAKQIGNIKFAVMAKPFLRGRKSTVLDVDLLIVGDVNLDILKRVISTAERAVDREINYAVMTEQDFVFRKRKNDHFVIKILCQSRVMLIGDEDEFSSLL